MLGDTLGYVLKVVLDLFALAALLRFYAQLLRAPFRNPIADFVIALTDWAVKPLRRVIPGLMGLDIASFIVAWCAAGILTLLLTLLAGKSSVITIGYWPTLAVFALVAVARLTIYLLMGVVLMQVLLSWTNPYHPVRPFFDALSQRFLRPIQRVLPPIGGVDLAPFALLVILQIILMLPITYLEGEVGRLLWPVSPG